MEKTNTVRAVARAIAVLRAFEDGSRLELRDIAAKAGLDRGTTRRLLMTLMTDGLVVQYENTGQYSLGPALRRLAGYVVDVDLRQIFAPHLEKLAVDLGTTAFLSVYRDHSAVCLERYHDLHGLDVRWWGVGGVLPTNCGAAPKVLLAFQSLQEVEQMLAARLSALTSKSIIDRDVLRRRLTLIRKRGWELAVDDVAIGLSALAVPVLDERNNLLGAISIAGLTPQMVLRGKPVHLDRLLEVVDSVNQSRPSKAHAIPSANRVRRVY